MSYQHKYRKYKSKYTKLKKKYEDQKYNFYFMHSTTNFQNLLDILKTGVLYPGLYLRLEQRKMCGVQPENDPCNNIYMNIYFEDLQNISHMWDYSLLFHPKIMNHTGFTFHKGWGDWPYVTISNTDSNKKIKKKINKIRIFLKNPSSLPELVQQAPGMLHHEVLFDHPISLVGNLIGIMCNYCDNNDTVNPPNKQLLLIKDAIKNKPYANVPIFTRNVPFPKLKNLIKN